MSITPVIPSIAKKVKLIYCYWGEGISIGISGPRDLVEQECNKLYNYKATDSNPMWLNEDDNQSFAYVLSDWDRLRKGIADSYITDFLMDERMKKNRFKGGFMPLALEKADEYISGIESEQFLGNHTQESTVFAISSKEDFSYSEGNA